MGFELNKGTLFMIDEDKTMELGKGIPFVEDIELSANEYLSHQYHLTTTSA